MPTEKFKNPQITQITVSLATIGRAKNPARSGHRLLAMAIRAGFEPFRALGSPFVSHKEDAFLRIGIWPAHATAQNRRGLF
jgi:hypothetical protein